MRIVLLSDTHGQHGAIEVPEGDMLLHAGDFSSKGGLNEVKDFLAWYAAQPHPHKVFIAGNHDFLAEKDPETFAQLIPPSLIYLNDSGATVAGIRIWGSPIQPWFYDWAFNRRRGPEIAQHWDLIPEDTEILITHGPPMGILDRTVRGDFVGCSNLTDRLQSVQPRLHVFGHIHEAYGRETIGPTTYINASNLDVKYRPIHPVQVFDWD